MIRVFSVPGFLFAFAWVVLGGCAGPQSVRVAAFLPGTTWTVERVMAPSGRVFHGEGESIVFRSDGTIRMSSCNHCSGTYQLRGRTLEVSLGPCTLMACAEEVIELESLVAPEMHVEKDGEYLILTPAAEEEGTRIMLLPAGDSEEPVPGDRRQSP